MSEFEELKRLPFIVDQLVAIQELHKPVKVLAGWTRCSCNLKDDMGLSVLWPCSTRKLADEALTDRMARTNQGENK